jgi:lactose/L-arabinose transport system substrate-binding protein
MPTAQLIKILLAGALLVASGVVASRFDQPRSEGTSRSGQASQPIVVWAWNTPAKSLRQFMPSFRVKHPDIDVRVEMIGSNMSRARFLLALSAGIGAPDVAMIEIQNVQQYAATKTLADLTERASHYASSFPPAFWDNCVYDGRVYAIPWDMGPCGVFYKDAVFRRYGVDAAKIESWDEFIAAGRKIVTASSGQTRMLPLATGEMSHMFELLLQQAGGQIFDAEGRVAINSPEAGVALDVLQRLVEADISANIAAHGFEVYSSFNTDAIACYVMPVWYGGMIRDATQAAAARQLAWRVMRLPAMQPGGLRNSNRGGSVLVIPAQTQHFDDAWKFVEFALCDVDSQLAHYQQFHLFPAFLPAHRDKRFDRPDQFFGGQHVSRLFTQQLEEIPALNRTADWLQAEHYLNRALSRWAATGMEAPDFLQTLAVRLARRLGREATSR